MGLIKESDGYDYEEEYEEVFDDFSNEYDERFDDSYYGNVNGFNPFDILHNKKSNQKNKSKKFRKSKINRKTFGKQNLKR